jgi:hypothetical protein
LHDSDSLLVAPIAVGGTVPWIVVPNEETQEFEMEQIDSVREKYGCGTIAVIATLSGTRRSNAA